MIACLLRSLPLLEVADLSYLHQGIEYYYRGGEGCPSYRRRPDRVSPLRLVHYTGSDRLADVLSICPKLRTFKLFVTGSLPSLGETLRHGLTSLDHVTLVYGAEHARLDGLADFLSACGERIGTLEVDCCSPETVTDVADLAAIAQVKKLKDKPINFNHDIFPSLLFKHCKFLDVLRFTSLTLPSSLSPSDFPSSSSSSDSPFPRPLSLPFLTELSASSVRVPAHGREFFKFLLGGCPDIEQLHLVNFRQTFASNKTNY